VEPASHAGRSLQSLAGAVTSDKAWLVWPDACSGAFDVAHPLALRDKATTSVPIVFSLSINRLIPTSDPFPGASGILFQARTSTSNRWPAKLASVPFVNSLACSKYARFERNRVQSLSNFRCPARHHGSVRRRANAGADAGGGRGGGRRSWSELPSG